MPAPSVSLRPASHGDNGPFLRLSPPLSPCTRALTDTPGYCPSPPGRRTNPARPARIPPHLCRYVLEKMAHAVFIVRTALCAFMPIDGYAFSAARLSRWVLDQWATLAA